MSRKVVIKKKSGVEGAAEASPLWWRPILSWQEYMNTGICRTLSAFMPSLLWDMDERGVYFAEKQMHRLCSEIYNAMPFFHFLGAGTQSNDPHVDIVENDERFLLQIDLPGVVPEDVHLSLTHDSLNISGIRSRPDKNILDQGDLIHRERAHGDFDRTIALPEEVDVERAVASIDKNILTIDLPKFYQAVDEKGTVMSAQNNKNRKKTKPEKALPPGREKKAA